MLLTRLCLATRLNCLARYLPTAISQPAPGSIDELLIATAVLTRLPRSTHGRGPEPHALRHALTITGAETSAPAQHSSSVATTESFIVKTGAALAELHRQDESFIVKTGSHTHVG